MSNAKWINLPVFAAIRRASIADTFSCDVDAHSSEADEVYKVVFTVTRANGTTSVHEVSQRSLRFPNFSNYGSRLPGAVAGFLSPSYCFGITLNCGSLPGGRTRISATVHYSNGGTVEKLPQDIFVLIDWDSDRRGSSKEIHFRGQTGNDTTGDGSPGNPVKTINKAISLVRSSPGGSTSNGDAMHCGGGKIIGGEAIQGCGPSFGTWHTGDQWLTIEFLPGSTWRMDDLNPAYNQVLCNGVGSDTFCSIRWANMELRGRSPTVQGATNVVVTNWVENLTHHSAFWTPGTSWSVRHLEDIDQTTPVVSSNPMTSATRVSGPAPLSVVFDPIGVASNVVQPAGGNPNYATFSYSWDFNDPSAGDWAHTGKSKNASRAWIGAHVFETPGTYRVRLTVTDAVGAVFDYHQDITVTDPDVVFAARTFYVASDGNDGNPGTIGQPFLTAAAGFAAAFGTSGAARLRFRRGDTFTTAGLTVSGTGPRLIDAYGTGARPRMVFTSGGFTAGSDVRFCDLDCSASGSGTGVGMGTQTTVCGCTLDGFSFGLGSNGVDQVCAYECEVLNSADYGCYLFGASDLTGGRHMAILGTLFDVAGQHLIRTYMSLSVIEGCHFDTPNPGFDHFKLVGRPLPDPSHHVCIVGNRIDVGSISDALNMGPENVTSTDQVATDYLVEGNFFYSRLGGNSCIRVMGPRITVRNNIFDLTDNRRAIRVEPWGGGPVPNTIVIEHNTAISAGTILYWLEADSSDLTVNRNNLFYCPGGTIETPIGDVTSSGNVTAVTNLFQTLGGIVGGEWALTTSGVNAAVDVGVASLVRYDFAGRPRPVGSGLDVGAFERQSVLSATAPTWSSGLRFSIAGPTSVVNAGKTFYTGLLSEGAAYGPENFSGIYDFRIKDYIGTAFHSRGVQQGETAINGIVERQRAKTHDIAGYINCQGGALFSVSSPQAGQLKITATGTVFHSDALDAPTAQSIDIADVLQEIAGSDYWEVNLENFGAHVGSRSVVSTGHDPNPYIIISYSGTVTPGTAPSNARLRTVLKGGDAYSPEPHLVRWEGTRSRPFYKNIGTADIGDSLGFTQAGNISDLVLFNCTDAGPGSNSFLAGGSILHGAIFEQNSFLGSVNYGLSQPATLNNRIRFNVFSDDLTGLEGGTGVFLVDKNHFLVGPTTGTNATAGAWYLHDPFTAPFSHEPLFARLSTGVLKNCPQEWLWPGTLPDPGIPALGVFANTGQRHWGAPTIGAGGISSAGSSSSAEGRLTIQGAGTSSASSSSSATPRLTIGGFAFSFSSSSSSATANYGSTLQASGTSTASSSSSATPVLHLYGAGVSTAGSSSSATVFAPETLLGSGISTATSSSQATPTLNVPPLPQIPFELPTVETKREMKHRIHNALRALCAAGPYYQCIINPKTGQMTIDFDKPVKPSGVVVKEVRSFYRNAKNYRREFNVQELESWSFVARVEFPPLEVTCEAFEETITASGIQIPPVIGLQNQRSLLARLEGCNYDQPAEQSPNRGTIAEFSFEIVTELLRK